MYYNAQYLKALRVKYHRSFFKYSCKPEANKTFSKALFIIHVYLYIVTCGICIMYIIRYVNVLFILGNGMLHVCMVHNLVDYEMVT